MKVAVVGYGRMGHEVESVLKERGHEAACIDLGQVFPSGCDVAIDFTDPGAVVGNVRAALTSGTRIVVGTTGWGAHLDEVRRMVAEAGSALVHAPNFSLGVNIYYRVVRYAAALFARLPDYDPYILEKHHRMKKDAPSGTAKALATIITEAQEAAAADASNGATAKRPYEDLNGGPLPATAFHVASVRAGGIVGEHLVAFDSTGDEILLEHRARTRRGLALGAVLAAEWVATRKGFFSFEEVLDQILG